MLSFTPLIDQRIHDLAPGFRAISILAKGEGLSDASIASLALDKAISQVKSGGPTWCEAHFAAWSEAFRSFGAKPQRTPCSAEALRRRVLRDGALPAINPVVDLYNAISLRYALPVGGENLHAYSGNPVLTIADGSESFDTLKEGRPATERPEKGEVIWRDDLGVTCRRWNWRQGVRTRIEADATEFWFILESLPAMPADALHAAAQELQIGLTRLLRNALVVTTEA
ncbi:B3/4 domain-containing protein [Achromobacter spanius]|uniref:B3/B4 domain-containing protein n=1 Tax=Achromobacter spanius TaxID=217203 RepID=UPI0038237BD5